MLRSAQTILVLLLLSAPASAATFGFECLTNSGACPTGASDIELDVQAGGAGEVVFTLSHVTVLPTALQAVYFEDNTLLSALLSVTNTPDVGFVIGSSPTVPTAPPGGGAFSWTSMVSTTGVGTPAPEYVTSGEEVVIVAALAGGVDVQDVIDAIRNESFRIGILLGDDGLITVPEPSLVLLLLGAGLTLARRMRRA